MMAKHRIHQVGTAKVISEVELALVTEIKALSDTTIADLKLKWREIVRQDPPPYAKRAFLTLFLAWELQARKMGGLDPALRRELTLLAKEEKQDSVSGTTFNLSPKLRPGVKLARLWKGKTHYVTVTDNGYFWNDTTYKSLSVIARKITGTPWSGPVFFGLKKAKAKTQAEPDIEMLQSLRAFESQATAKVNE